VIIVGAGNLGHALANYGGFASRGFRVAAIFDSDPLTVGTRIGSQAVRNADEIESVIAGQGVSIGVIATPAAAAQAVCERLVTAGITSILNFAPVVLSVPPGVDVRKVDLSIELQILAFHAQRRAVVRVNGSAPVGGAPPVVRPAPAVRRTSAVRSAPAASTASAASARAVTT
jgi:redox-sensing transcriptional repressor